LYHDPQGRMRRVLKTYAEEPEIQNVDEAREEHRLSPITEARLIDLIQDFFAQRQLYIADGHHRYETALNYRNELLAQRGKLSPDDRANFTMMALTDIDDACILL